MAEPSEDTIQDYLEKLAAAMGEHVVIPDFDDLYERGEGEGVVGMSPDDIETMLVMAEQRAEQSRQDTAEQERVAAQWDIASGMQTRTDTVPPQPSEAELNLLPAEAAKSAGTSIQAAQDSYGKLNDARGGPDEAFESATAEATSALDGRDEAIAGLHAAVKDEKTRRQTARNTAAKTLADERAKLAPEVLRVLPTGTQKAILALRDNLAKLDAGMQAVDKEAPNGTQTRFDETANALNELLKLLPQQVKNANTVGQNVRGDDRKLDLANLQGQRSVPALHLTMFTGSDLATAWTQGQATHKDELAKLQKLAPKGSAEEWSKQKTTTEAALKAMETAHKSLTDAISSETTRRTTALKTVKDSMAAIKAPKLVTATEEHKTFETARQTAVSSIRAAEDRLGKAAPKEFDDAVKTADDDVKALKDAGEASGKKAEAREDVLKALRDTLNDTVKALTATVIGMTCPVPGLKEGIKAAVKAEMDVRKTQINGRNAEQDKTSAEAFTDFATSVTGFVKAANKVHATSYEATQNSVDIVAVVKTLMQAVTDRKWGDASSAATLLALEVTKKTAVYAELDTLKLRYVEASKDKKILPTEQKTIQAIPDFVKNRDTIAKGTITSMLTPLNTALFKIEAVIETAKQDAEYAASKVAKFINDFEAGTINAPVVLKKLIDDNFAKRGPLVDAFRAGDDFPDMFSVENTLPVENKGGLIVHAHCGIDGKPKPDHHAWHVKLSKAKYAPIYINLPEAMRATVLHSDADNLAKAKAKKLVA